MRMTAVQARARFHAARVARLATVSASGMPQLVPVTFAVLEAAIRAVDPGRPSPDRPSPPGERMVFAVDHKPKSTTALRRLANIAANPRVTFLVDEYQEDWERLWWARADGRAEILHGPERAGALTALLAKYRQYTVDPPDGVVVVTTIERWTGWQAFPFADHGGK